MGELALIECRKTFVCPKCKLDFITERDLRYHQCDADEAATSVVHQPTPKKARASPLANVFKKKVLKDEVEILNGILRK